MERSDLLEIRKVVKSKESCVSWVYSLYVDADNQPCYENVQRLAEMEDAERFRHLGIFAKVLSTRLGRDAFPVRLEAQKDSLLELRSSSGGISEFEEFRDQLLAGYSHTDPYYATLVRVIYDVPLKSKDGRRLEDGDAVYEALIFSLCPAKLSKPVLGFDEDHVVELNRRWQIGNPVSGFLYPAFSDRAEDRNLLLLHSTRPEEESFINNFFQVDADAQPVGVKMQKDLFSSLIGQMDVNLESAAAITETLLEKSAEEDVTTLGREDVRSIVEAAGVDTAEFDEIYSDTVGETPILAAAVAESSVAVKTDSAVIKVPSEQAQLIETRRIDGRDYILIPADGTVTVNGVAVSASGRTEAALEP